MTVEELLARPDDQHRYELWWAELVGVPHGQRGHGVVGMRIANRMWNHAEEHRLGEVHKGDTSFILARAPDVMLLPAEIFAGLEPGA
jgi:hypothetical protein